MESDNEEKKHYELQQTLIHIVRRFAAGGYETQRELPADVQFSSEIMPLDQIISPENSKDLRALSFMVRHPGFQNDELVDVLALLSERTRSAFLLDKSISVSDQDAPEGQVTRLHPVALYLTGAATSIAFNKSATSNMIRSLICMLGDLCAHRNNAVAQTAMNIAARIDVEHHGIWHDMLHGAFQKRLIDTLYAAGHAGNVQKQVYKIMDDVRIAADALRNRMDMERLSIAKAPQLNAVA